MVRGEQMPFSRVGYIVTCFSVLIFLAFTAVTSHAEKGLFAGPSGMYGGNNSQTDSEDTPVPGALQSTDELTSDPASAQKINELLKRSSRQKSADEPGFDGQNDDAASMRQSLSTDEQLKRNVLSISPIEQAMLEQPVGIDKIDSSSFAVTGLTQFGYSYFRQDTQGLEQMNDVPVGPDYLLGAGDVISLTMWGSSDGQYTLKVNRSGEITLPKVGPVKVAGVEFGKLPSLISGSLAKVYRDFHINVTMGKLRLMKVFVVGEVVSPGDYSISSLSTVMNAISVASGPTKNGSLRTIQVKRDGKTAAHVDLYDFFTKGDKSSDIRLQPGDTIFVPTIGPVAGIAGTVRRPGIYELTSEKSLNDLISLAGGVTSAGYLQRLQVARIQAHDKKVVTDINLDPKGSGKTLEDVAAAIILQDMDLVKIFPIDGMLRNYVKVDGYVYRPGDYALNPGAKISNVLTDASPLPEYYMEAGQIERVFPPDNHREIVNFNVARALAGDPVHDLELKEFDRIVIFPRWSMEEMPKVKIVGEVQKPGEYRLFDNMTLRDLVLMAGNPKNTAYLKNTEIVRLSRSHESVVSSQIYVNLEEALKGGAKDNITLQPYDEVVIRKIPNWNEVADSYITLKGEVLFPGVYPIYKGDKLSSVIRRAGGFTAKAYLNGARFTRESLRIVQQKRMDEVLAREEAHIALKQGELASVAASKEELEATKASLDGLKRSIEMLKKKKAEGRMVITLLPEELFTDSQYDFEVLAGDQLEIPADPKVVSVFGQVYNPNNYQFVKGATVEEFLGKSGGFTRDAEDADIYILKADGTVISRTMADGMFFGRFMDKELESGDSLVVPQKLERVAWIRDIKDITTIVSQVAMTAGVLIAAGL